MALTLSTFSNQELLTASKLNSILSDISGKFNAGITQVDMSWPFAVGGNFDMRYFQLLNIPRFWKYYNLADRDTGSGVTIQNVYDAVSGEGGGVVFVPPDTTIIMDAINIPSNVITVGSGWTSILRQQAIPSRADMIRLAEAAVDVWFVNLRIDGVNGGGTAVGIQTRASNRAKFINIFFSDWAVNAAQLNNAGSDGVGSTDTLFDRCFFDNTNGTATTAHVSLIDCDVVNFSICTFGIVHTGSIVVNAANNTRKVKDIKFTTCRWSLTAANVTNPAISFTKVSTTLTAYQSGLTFENCDFDGNGVNSLCGLNFRYWQNINISNTRIHECTSARPAIRFRDCSGFSVNNNEIWDWDGDGIVVGSTGYDGTAYASRTDTPCTDFSVQNNRLWDIGLAGIIWTGNSSRWQICNNKITDCSQITDATYYGFEYWFTSDSINTGGSNFNNNTSYDTSTVGNDQAGGMITFSNGGTGGGTTRRAVGRTAASNLTVVGNALPGMVIGNVGVGTDDFQETIAARFHAVTGNAGFTNVVGV